MNAPSSWLTALCSVVFDLRVGQKIESVVPSGALNAKEQSDVAFHTFPDSLSQELRVCASVRDSCFFFRIRRQRVLYGFVFCRQRQDERLVRGMDRRAVVVVSPFPFSGVLRPLATFLGAVYFAEGPQGLERVYEQILSWPAPQLYRLMELKVAGHVIRATLPPSSLFPPPAPHMRGALRRTTSSRRNRLMMQKSSSSSAEMLEAAQQGVTPCNALFSEVDVREPFRNILPRLWSLWELTLTGQPLAIVAPSPVECSAAVAALISVIAPVPYACDFRPYFTIHDPEFASMLGAQDSRNSQEGSDWSHQSPTLVGVTNLYFVKALPLWPNVVSIGERPPIQSSAQAASNGKTSFRRFSPRTALQSFKSRTLGSQVLLSHHVENLWSSQKLLVKPDMELCKEINLRPLHAAQNSEMLRLHFSTLTAAFLEPFMGYFVPVKGSKLRSVNGSFILSLEASGLPEFDRSEFLASIVDWPFPSLLRNRFNSMQDIQSFYETFLDSPNFTLWFERQQEMVALDLGLPEKPPSDLERPNVIDLDDAEIAVEPKNWNCTDEVKMVEDFWRLQSELMNEMQDISTADSGELPQAPSQSERDFILVFSSMPDDLRRILLSSPAQVDFVKRLRQIPDIRDYLHDLTEFVV